MDGEPRAGEYLGPDGERVRVAWDGSRWISTAVDRDRFRTVIRTLTDEHWRALRPLPASVP